MSETLKPNFFIQKNNRKISLSNPSGNSKRAKIVFGAKSGDSLHFLKMGLNQYNQGDLRDFVKKFHLKNGLVLGAWRG